MVGSILAGLATGGLSNLMSEWHADKQQAREKELMDYQNSLNKANALDAYRTSVQGMRMAGLNPAIAQDSKPLAPEVSKGSVSQAENVEFDPQTMLLQAQAANLNAQTEKTEAETKKIEGVDTSNTIADTLLKNASADEKKALTERTNQINQQYTDQNKALEGQGQAMAQKWQSEKWYKALAPDTRATIDGIADGSIPLTVGAMDALGRTIHIQADLSDADAKLVKNAFANAVLASQFSDKAVFDSIVQDPKVKQSLTQEQTKKLTADIERIRYRMRDVIDSEIDKMDSERNVNNADYWMKLKQKLAFEYENMDLSRGEGRYGNYAWRMLENTVSAVVDILKSVAAAFVGAKIVGSGIKSGVESATRSSSQTNTTRTIHHNENDKSYMPPMYDSHGNEIRPGQHYWTSHDEHIESGQQGVQQMKFNR